MNSTVLEQVFSTHTSSNLFIFDEGKYSVPVLVSEEPIFLINYLVFYILLISFIPLLLTFFKTKSQGHLFKRLFSNKKFFIQVTVISAILFTITGFLSFLTAQSLEEEFKNPPIFTQLTSPGVLSFTLEHRNYKYYLYTFSPYKSLSKPIYKEDFRTAHAVKKKLNNLDITYCEVTLISQSEIQSDIILNMLQYNHITNCINSKDAIINYQKPRNLEPILNLRSLKNEELSSNAK